MPDSLHPSSTVAISGVRTALSPAEKEAVLAELGRVVDSAVFHSSPRCQEFLRYVVTHTVEGSAALLKERNIGVDVFHRSPAYEPNTDSIVRVRATEVRKRLTQYYDQQAAGSGVRIVLPSGSYSPEFHWTSQGAEPPPAATASAPRQKLWRRVAFWFLIVSLSCLLVAGAAYLAPVGRLSSPLRDFWQPSLNGSNSVVICLGQPVVYHLSRRVHEAHLRTLPPDRQPGPYVIPLKPGSIEASDVLPVPDQYVGAGSAQAAAKLSALLAGWSKPSEVRVGNDFSFYDLRNHPAILVGAFSNVWAMKLSASMPFVFISENGVRGIQERANPRNAWRLNTLQGDGKTTEDYAIIARVFDSGTLEPLVLAAGITQYGTQAAAEFISDENSFATAEAKAPKDWRTRNLQILLHLNVIGKVPGKPEVVAVRAW